MLRIRKCDVCRKRKVRCDEARPACAQCEIKGRACTWTFADSIAGTDALHIKYHARLISTEPKGRGGLDLKYTSHAPIGTGLFQTFTSDLTIKTVRIKSRSKSKPISKSPSSTTPTYDGVEWNSQSPSSTTSTDSNIGPCGQHEEEPLQVHSSRSFLYRALAQQLVKSSLCAGVDNPTAYRQQLKMILLDIEFPHGTFLRHQLIPLYNQWFEPRGRAMQTAVDCILLLYLSRVSGMAKLRNRIQGLHALAIQQLSLEMRAPASGHDDGVLGAIEALEIAGQFRELDLPSEHWLIHFKGLETVLKTRGPKSMSSDFARKVLFNFLPVAVIKALETRQALFLGETAWQATLQRLCYSPMSRLALLSCRIPAILADVEELINNDINMTLMGRRVTILHEAQEIKQMLLDWLHDWWELSAHRSCQPVTLDQRFQAFVRDFSHLPKIFPFGQAYEYDNGLDVVQHAWYLICSLGLERALLDLDNIDNNQTDCIQRAEQCDYLAEAICMTVPYIHSGRGHVPYADTAVCTFVTFASRWFETRGQDDRVVWCWSVRSKLEDQDWNTALLGNLPCVNRVFGGWSLFANSP